MRVFLAGATGAVGRRLVPMLVAAGHHVTGLTRSPGKLDVVRALGAQAVLADALDAGAVTAALRQARPEVVIHQLTAIPPDVNPKTLAEDFAATNRLRAAGTDILLTAAREAGARRFLAQSFGGYMWAPGVERALTEQDQRGANAPPGLREVTAAIEHLERVVPEAGGLVLRYGAFYGPGTAIGEGGPTLEAVRKRAFPLVGGGGVWSFVHIDDVALATMLAMDQGEAGVYNVADDEPARVSEWLPLLAEAIGARPPRRVPMWLGRLLAGETAVTLLNSVRGIVNTKAKAELGWELRYPSWRQGFRQGLR